MVLFIFVIMLLNAGEEDTSPGLSRVASIAGFPGAAAIFCLLTFVFVSERKEFGFTQIGGCLSNATNNIAELSHVLFTSLLLPFEVTSILILVAILGAVVLARKEL
jgi:NADH-quinone oxidoreductase subunit J